MKLHTQPDGTMTVGLSVPERKAVAHAHTVLEQAAFHTRNTHPGAFYKQVAEDLLSILASAPEKEETPDGE